MKSFLKHLRSIPMVHYGERLRPLRDWFILLAVAGVLLIASLAANVWLFGQLTSGGRNGSATVAPSLELNKEALDAVQKVFSDREAEESKYTDGTYHFVDPSK